MTRLLLLIKVTNEMAFIDENKVQTVVSVGTGKTQELTPEGLFTITVKAKNPYYRERISLAGIQKSTWGQMDWL